VSALTLFRCTRAVRRQPPRVRCASPPRVCRQRRNLSNDCLQIWKSHIHAGHELLDARTTPARPKTSPGGKVRTCSCAAQERGLSTGSASPQRPCRTGDQNCAERQQCSCALITPRWLAPFPVSICSPSRPVYNVRTVDATAKVVREHMPGWRECKRRCAAKADSPAQLCCLLTCHLAAARECARFHPLGCEREHVAIASDPLPPSLALRAKMSTTRRPQLLRPRNLSS
jgi:hypothetical protein